MMPPGNAMRSWLALAAAHAACTPLFDASASDAIASLCRADCELASPAVTRSAGARVFVDALWEDAADFVFTAESEASARFRCPARAALRAVTFGPDARCTHARGAVVFLEKAAQHAMGVDRTARLWLMAFHAHARAPYVLVLGGAHVDASAPLGLHHDLHAALNASDATRNLSALAYGDGGARDGWLAPPRPTSVAGKATPAMAVPLGEVRAPAAPLLGARSALFRLFSANLDGALLETSKLAPLPIGISTDDLETCMTVLTILKDNMDVYEKGIWPKSGGML